MVGKKTTPYLFSDGDGEWQIDDIPSGLTPTVLIEGNGSVMQVKTHLLFLVQMDRV